ncbi:MAG: diguanylate cyclase, partial [Azoarcus sp.]|nr:diguanylate cyclase [Azoarcus sp.]
MPYRTVVLIASSLLAAIFAAVAVLSLQQVDERFTVQREQEATRLQSVYLAAQAELEHEALTLAYSMASEPEKRRLLAEATQVFQVEGSGGPGIGLLRQALNDRMREQWRGLHDRYDLRQLQFLLAPDLISFLRLHALGEYGDTLIDLRPLLRGVQDDLVPRSGFEIGRAYAGIRGGVPVMSMPDDGPSQPVGVLEVGLGLEGLLMRLSNKLDIGIAVLLKSKAVSHAMWETYRPDVSSPAQRACCYLLSSSRPEAAEWINASMLDADTTGLESDLLEWQGTPFHTVQFPLRDHLGQLDPLRPAVGTILIWRAATAQLAAHKEARSTIIRTALMVYAVTQFLMLALLRRSRSEWQRQLDLQTAAIAHLSHQNELLLHTAGEGIYGVDRDGLASFVNPSALRMLGYRNEQIIGHNQHRLFHYRHADGTPYPDEECPVFMTLRDGKARECEDWFIRANGSGFPVAMTVTPIDEQGHRKGVVVVFRDISELKARQEELIRLATTDPLTGVSNRRHFLELLDAELARVKRLRSQAALLMTDLDHFKQVNDAYGHAAGDQVLKHYVGIIRQTLRKTDSIGRL